MSDAAKLLDTSEERIYAWVDEGSIPFYEVSEQYRFNRAELLEWATARGVRVSVEIFQRTRAQAVSLVDALEAGGVHTVTAGSDQEALITALVAELPIPDEADRALVLDVLRARGAPESNVGDGIVIPHVRSPIVLHGSRPSITLVHVDPRSAERPASIFVMITPTPKVHLDLLSRLTSALHDPELRRSVIDREDLASLLEIAARVEATFDGPSEAAPTMKPAEGSP